MGLRTNLLLVVSCFWFVGAPGWAQPPAPSGSLTNRFPLRASADGHSLHDQAGQPFLFLADAAWLLPYSLTSAEATEYMAVRRAQGFTVLHLQILPDSYTLRTQAGQLPLNQVVDRGLPDLSVPNEPFFAHLDTLIHLAARHELAVMLAPAWLGTGVTGWQYGLEQNGADKARAFGQFLGNRYRHDKFPNVIGWIHGGGANPGAVLREVQALAEGIQGVEGQWPRLHTGHWQSPFSTRDQTPALAWLNLNATQTSEPNRIDTGLPQFQIYAAALRDYQRQPAQPTLLLGSDLDDPGPDAVVRGVSDAVLRRQVWWALLSGSAGVTYTSVTGGLRRTDWREMLHRPAARQMRVAQELLTSLPWPELVPDGLPDPRRADTHRLVVDGGGTFYAYPGLPGNAEPVSTTALAVAPSPGSDYIVAAALPDRSVLVAYIPPTGSEPRSFAVDLTPKVARPLMARWVNPVTGQAVPINPVKTGRQTLTTPGDNGTGQNDWLLVVRPR